VPLSSAPISVQATASPKAPAATVGSPALTAAAETIVAPDTMPARVTVATLMRPSSWLSRRAQATCSVPPSSKSTAASEALLSPAETVRTVKAPNVPTAARTCPSSSSSEATQPTPRVPSAATASSGVEALSAPESTARWAIEPSAPSCATLTAASPKRAGSLTVQAA